MIKSPTLQFLIFFFLIALKLIGQEQLKDRDSTTMLKGDWFVHSKDINFEKLPRIPLQRSTVNDVRAIGTNYQTFKEAATSGGCNQHNYLTYYKGLYWCMWSDGPGVEDRVGQVVKYATSRDGLKWSNPKFITDYPPNSAPGSPYYNTRNKNGFRWISRGFWQRNGELLALASLDEAAEFFGPSLQLRAFHWVEKLKRWEDFGLVSNNTINNFSPEKIATGEWLLSRRTYDYKTRGVDFLVGGTKNINDWQSFPVFGSASELEAEEPFWWILPDGKSLMALFRDNRKGGYLFRSFSSDNARSWSHPVQTNFPDATSKFHGIRLKDGRYVMVSNPNPKQRDPLVLSVSDDGQTFTKMGYLVGGGRVEYPHMIEHKGYILIAFNSYIKQKIEVLKVRIADLDKLDMKSYSNQKIQN
ncbi:MAG: exo-alpha-sialidase [Bacteroidia bacterium]|nr:exo-alpha-sialidase [Bacteroidia bacterium]